MIYYLLLGYTIPGFIAASFIYYLNVKYEELIDRSKREKRLRTKSFRETEHYQKTEITFTLLLYSSLIPIYNIILCLFTIYAVPKMAKKYKKIANHYKVKKV